MSTKHTPGPWHWVNSRTDKPFDFDADWDGEGRPSLRTVMERKKRDCESAWELPDWILDAEPMQHGNDAANARLIAAAPELLEFAREFLADYMSDDGLGSMKHYANKAHAAIAKATGEQP